MGIVYVRRIEGGGIVYVRRIEGGEVLRMFVENSPESLAPVDKKLRRPPLERLSAVRKQKDTHDSRGPSGGSLVVGKGLS